MTKHIRPVILPAASPAIPVPDHRRTILVATHDDETAALVAAGLAGFEHARIHRVEDADAIALHLIRAKADAAIIVSNRPDPQAIAALRAIGAVRPLPVVLFVTQSDPGEIDAAIGAGATALVVDGFDTGRIGPVLQIAHCRFAANEALRAELAQARSELAARKVIERAKGILMERRSLTEADAYAMLRRSAMQDGKTIAEIAEAIMAADRLLTA